jgi:hypothetical protein
MIEEYQNDDDLSYVSFENVVNSSQDFNGEPVKNTWFDAFTARQIIFPDGQMEISVSQGKHFCGPAFLPQNKAKRGESENREVNDATAGRAAKKRVRQACKMIGADRLVTLTYRDNVTDRELALKHWKAFVRRLRKGTTDFHYVAVMELQKRGAIHFHVAVRGRQSYFLLRSIWQSVIGNDGQGRKMSQVNVRDPHRFGFGKDGVHKLAAYIAKYCTKQMECRDFDQKRFFTSRGIVKPEVLSWRLASDTMLSAVETAFAIAAQGKLEGLTAWCNNALGCVWIATAPGRSADNPFTAPF